jgi:hypothetical protein
MKDKLSFILSIHCRHEFAHTSEVRVLTQGFEVPRLPLALTRSLLLTATARQGNKSGTHR